MFVRFMFADEWENRTDVGKGTIDPTWCQIEQAIAALDGKRKTMVLLSDREGGNHHMGISGQWGGRLMAYATRDNIDFFSLIDSSRSRTKRTLYVGGQDGEYEERRCVPLDWVLEAARSFAETGELNPTLNWKSDY